MKLGLVIEGDQSHMKQILFFLCYGGKWLFQGVIVGPLDHRVTEVLYGLITKESYLGKLYTADIKQD